MLVQKDYTTPPFGTMVGVSVGGPLPIWDHNQGNIMAAEAAVSKASEGPHFARDDLTARLADAYERYQDNMKVIDYYRRWMLPDQVQAYRGAYQRHQTEPDVVGFADVVDCAANAGDNGHVVCHIAGRALAGGGRHGKPARSGRPVPYGPAAGHPAGARLGIALPAALLPLVHARGRGRLARRRRTLAGIDAGRSPRQIMCMPRVFEFFIGITKNRCATSLGQGLERIKSQFPDKEIFVYVPTRDPVRGAAYELRAAAHKDKTLPLGLLKHSQFPAEVTYGSGDIIHKPASW